MRKLLLAATALVGSTGIVLANNAVNIDISGGGTAKTLTITQDTANPSNFIAGNAAGAGAFTVRGPWNALTMSQSGATNKMYGAMTSATTGNLSATYAGGKNSHSLTIGAAHAPNAPSVTVSMTNTGAGTNALTDALNVTGAALTYNMTMSGTGNTVGNTVNATGATGLTETITASDNNTVANSLTGGATTYNLTIDTGNTNSVTNTVATTGAINMTQGLHGGTNVVSTTVGGTTPVTSYTETLAVTGSGNGITNVADNGGDKTISVTLASDNNTVNNSLTGTGTQSSTLLADSGTWVDFGLTAPAQNSSSSIILTNVTGNAEAAVVRVNQTVAANNATINFTIDGGAFTMGKTLVGNTVGANITQASAGASLTGTFTAAANGYTVSVSQ